MKKLLLSLLILCGLVAQSQVYNNEWIDYSKTYYKFKSPKTGLHRISQATLVAAGLGSVPAEHFQLWRNGVEVPLYTTVATGVFSGSDYIEFWGEMNDGRADKALYRQASYQLNDKYSLATDSATYFLTVNPTGNSKRLVTTPNNVSGTSLLPEPYFMYTAGKYYKDRLNPGFAVDVEEYLYSSSYDAGEGWTSVQIGHNGSLSFTFNNLYLYSGGPAPGFKISVSGNGICARRYRVTINGDSIIENSVSFFNHRTDSTAFLSSTIASDVANVIVYNVYDSGNSNKNRMVVHKYEMVYPRQFNFGGASNFEFNLPASAIGNYLEITNFNYGGGSVMPVLYDITNGKRYVAEVSGGVVKVVLEGSSTERKLILVNEELSNTTAVTTLQSRTFTDYSLAQNQGDYMIISHPMLYNGSTGNPVEDYRVYRSSVNGGSYNAKVYNIDDIVDQFGFGILKNPLGLRNFIWFARNTFPVAPKHVFLIGKAISYNGQLSYQSNPDFLKLSIVPTFGWPASDVLLAADPGSSQPKTPIGRLSVINANEVALYLKKVKDHETTQRISSPLIADKAWMKNVVHAVGASSPDLQRVLDGMMRTYGGIIADTSFGAKVTTFTKSSASSVEQINNGALDRLFEEGITLFTYFGHSSSSSLEFNMNDPEQYNNQGKYPMFIALGCNAGNFFNFNTARFATKETLSEKYVLAQDRGTIGFIASSHFGIVHYLDIYNSRNYRAISYLKYGQSMGEIMKSAIEQTFAYATQGDFYARAQCEETVLHGDPAVTLNPHAKPDYVIEDPMVKVTPAFVSVADQTFKLSAAFMNIGKAINKTVVAQVTREYPNGVSEVIHRDTMNYIKFTDTLVFDLLIDPIRDKGLNKLTIKIDADEEVDELYETNNTITKEIFIYEDEARPIFPYNYSIVSDQNTKLKVSTANPFSTSKTYRMEIDTTELFNSPLKQSADQISAGGILEFNPGLVFTDSTVYYWRVAPLPVSGPITWNTSSFVFINNHDAGFNQSHLYQHLKSSRDEILLDSSSRLWTFDSTSNALFIRNAIFPTAATQQSDFTISVNNVAYIGGGCYYDELIINVFDPVSFQAWKNVYAGGTGLYGSLVSACADRRDRNFEYLLTTAADRKKAMDFLDMIPDGHFVVIRGNVNSNPAANTYPPVWLNDSTLYGSGNTLYHRLYNQGFTAIDTFNTARTWSFMYKKNGQSSFVPQYMFSEGIYDKILMNVEARSIGNTGHITSPVVGPATEWKQLIWIGETIDTAPADSAKITILGHRLNGVDTLFRDITSTQFDISTIDANQYPHLQMVMETKDTAFLTPYQLKYWRLTYTPAPEGAVAPNILFWMRDSVDVGDTLEFKLAFKNVSNVNFTDSMKVKAVITDRNNVAYTVPLDRQKVLLVNDTLTVRLDINSRQFIGANQLFVEFNPDNDQPEQYHFNNFVYYNFYIKGDYLAPLLDVTFDNIHIVNRDIVSAKPHIQIKLKDESSTLLLDDSSLVNVQIMDPDGIITSYQYGTDTLNFTPAQQSSNNTAMVDFKPYFTKDGDYELIVKGEDKSGNSAGNMEYRVGFRVISKAMISNMLNYPNPFTTSTAFVFTITGSEVPQNIKIQILTITGKVVREITKDELGPLRVGRNITEYKWDGTDQYGQKLANGVYLYRVITNLNGKALEKFRDDGDETDKYFNKGYGKMYLMR